MNRLNSLNQFDVLDALAASDFNLHLTAEKLDTTIAKVLSQLSTDTESTIINHMKLRMTLETYTLWKNLIPMYVEAFVAADPKDRIKAFSQLTETMSSITKSTQAAPQGTQIGQVVLNMLPPDVRDRVLQLLPNDVTIIDQDENSLTAIADTQAPVQSERTA